MVARKPTVLLADVPVPAQRAVWSFVPGMRPHALPLLLPRDMAVAIWTGACASGGVTTLKFATSYELGEDVDVEFEVKGVVVADFNGATSPYDARITAYDRRWWMAGALVTASYNRVVPTNDRAVIGKEVAGNASARPLASGGTQGGAASGGSSSDSDSGPGTAPLSPLKPGSDRDTLVVKERYLPWSVRKSGAPCTAKYIAESLLMQVSRRSPSGSPRKKLAEDILAAISPLTDNGYWEDDVRYVRDDAVGAIEDQLAKAELGIGVSDEGDIYGWNIRRSGVALGDGGSKLTDELLEVITPFLPPIQGGGWLEALPLQMRRPYKIYVETPAEWELRLEAKETWYEEWEKLLYPYMQNVLQLPQDVDNGGTTYRKGTWVSIEDALSLWAPDLPLVANPWSRKPLTLARMRSMWFPSGKLTQAYTLVLGASGQYEHSSVWAPRIAALLSSYRQVWRINPGLYQYVEAIEFRRSRIVDARTRSYAKPFIAADHCIIPNVSMPEFKRRRGKAGTNVPCWNDDASAPGVQGAALVVSWEDQALGVLRIGADVSKKVSGEVVQTYVPSQVENLPILAGAALMSSQIWSKAKLAEGFNATLIVTARYAQQPDAMMRSRDQDKAALADVSGLTWRHPISAPAGSLTNPQLTISLKDDRLVAQRTGPSSIGNPDQIQAVSQARSEEIYARLRDRLVGTFEIPGYAPGVYRLFGTVAGIHVTFSPKGRLSTVWDLTGKPIAVPDILRLPKDVRKIIYRRLADTAPAGR